MNLRLTTLLCILFILTGCYTNMTTQHKIYIAGPVYTLTYNPINLQRNYNSFTLSFYYGNNYEYWYYEPYLGYYNYYYYNYNYYPKYYNYFQKTHSNKFILKDIRTNRNWNKRANLQTLQTTTHEDIYKSKQTLSNTGMSAPKKRTIRKVLPTMRQPEKTTRIYQTQNKRKITKKTSTNNSMEINTNNNSTPKCSDVPSPGNAKQKRTVKR